MLRKLFLLLAVLFFTGVITACGSREDEAVGDEHMEDEHMEDEHMEDEDMDDEHIDDDMSHLHVDPPDEFAGLTNPFDDDEEAISAGQEIFSVNCQTCHGPEGAGDGPGSVGLDPKPADLGDGAMMHDLSDGYLFWRVSQGGAMEPFNSAMPSWIGLSEEQRWQVISYIRTLSEQ